MDYSKIPQGTTLQPTPFRACVSEAQLADFQQLLSLARLGPETYENLQEDGHFGISYKWLSNAVRTWQTEYDWRQTEKRINSFPNYTVPIPDQAGQLYHVHFVAIFSENPKAVPIVMLHGWPGSFLEFLPVLEILRTRFSPSTLPYHMIVPSLVGYGFSSGPLTKSNIRTPDVAWIINSLMVGLGFGNGYVAQGGDIGSYVARVLGSKFSECKAVHLNFCGMQRPENVSNDSLSETEQNALERTKHFPMTGFAYALEHATRPSTIGFVLSSNPVALLSWVGEKFQAWAGQKLILGDILDSVTLYWFTDTISRSFYPYRDALECPYHGVPEYFIHKPLGFSFFPHETMPTPKSWVKTTGNLVWSRLHEQGGHFAALERPVAFLRDIEEFVAEVWS